MLDVRDDLSAPPVDCVAIRDPHGWILAKGLDDTLRRAIAAVASEDPESFGEMVLLWPRYRVPGLPESLNEIEFCSTNETDVRNALAGDPRFLVIDLCSRRLVTGPEFAVLSKVSEHLSKDRVVESAGIPIELRLPTWWRLDEQVKSNEATAFAATPDRPTVDRELLYGMTMARAFAQELIAVYPSARNRQDCEHGESDDIDYDLMVEIHRKWLMTPRDEMQGRYPRQLLHGFHRWIESLARSQQDRYLAGTDLIAAPNAIHSVRNGPIGFHEMVTYFDYCREAIVRGWQFLHEYLLVHHNDSIHCEPSLLADRLAETILHATDQWMDTPDSDGLTPRFIIDCERRRVPLSSEIPVVGLPRPTSPQHDDSCQCPSCEMADAGYFGPSFEIITGHHLDLDDEYAFSIFEDYDEWNINRLVPDGEDDLLLGDDSDSDPRSAEDPIDEVDDESDPTERSPIWRGVFDDSPPTERTAFAVECTIMLAEILSDLETAGAPEMACTSVNVAFARFCESSPEHSVAAVEELGSKLEMAALLVPSLMPKVIDFRSRIDQAIRCAAGAR